jgi:GTP-binding protein HflX
MSARQRIGLSELVDEILKRVYAGHKVCQLVLPFARGDLFSYLKERANVLSESYEADGIHVTVECSEADMGRIEPYIQTD